MHSNMNITLTDIPPEFEKAIIKNKQIGYIYHLLFNKLVVNEVLYFSEEQLMDFKADKPFSEIKISYYFTNGENEHVAVWGIGKTGMSTTQTNIFRLCGSDHVVCSAVDSRSSRLFMPTRDDKKAKEMYIDWLERKNRNALEDAKFFEKYKNITENTDVVER